jgi:hypothetical protein
MGLRKKRSVVHAPLTLVFQYILNVDYYYKSKYSIVFSPPILNNLDGLLAGQLAVIAHLPRLEDGSPAPAHHPLLLTFYLSRTIKPVPRRISW